MGRLCSALLCQWTDLTVGKTECEYWRKILFCSSAPWRSAHPLLRLPRQSLRRAEARSLSTTSRHAAAGAIGRPRRRGLSRPIPGTHRYSLAECPASRLSARAHGHHRSAQARHTMPPDLRNIMTPADTSMPATDRLPRPSHRSTWLPDRPATLRALAVSRHRHTSGPDVSATLTTHRS
jgi:hypothetical protein